MRWPMINGGKWVSTAGTAWPVTAQCEYMHTMIRYKAWLGWPYTTLQPRLMSWFYFVSLSDGRGFNYFSMMWKLGWTRLLVRKLTNSVAKFSTNVINHLLFTNENNSRNNEVILHLKLTTLRFNFLILQFPWLQSHLFFLENPHWFFLCLCYTM